MKAVNDLKVTSHVGRDILASASAFKTEASVAWEYIANSLQYIDRGVNPVVDVRVGRNQIVISDNGRGMDVTGLELFFTMHAENQERRAGRPGRGKWGTGKSAAFGIANRLRVETVRNGLKNVVELTRDAIDASDGTHVPVTWLVRNEASSATNGTIVTISDLLIKVDASTIIEYVERHLPFFRGSSPQVAVNNHVCEFREPTVSRVRTFRPTAAQAKIIGEVELTIKVATSPLKEFEQGIAVTAGAGNLVAIERAGMERKEFGSYLFGDVDVPGLENPSIPIAPYDATRSLQLNPKHPVVATLLGFIGSKLELVRNELLDEQKQARQTEQARRLERESQRIADVINQDYRELRRRLQEIRSATAAAGAASGLYGQSGTGDEDDDVWVAGVDEPGTVVKPDVAGGQGHGKGRPRPNIIQIGERDEAGNDTVSPAGGEGSARRKPRGGFSVDYRPLGVEEDRSKYDAESMTIIINLDHPVVVAALGEGGVESPTFRRLSYEVAFAEYSIALGYQMSDRDPDMPAFDLLYEVRSTLQRVARASAALYA